MARMSVVRGRKAAKRTPSKTVTAVNPDRYLDMALNEQNEGLFDAQAIIQACAHGIEENFGEQMDSNQNNVPSYPRALQEASRMIERACGQLEMMALRARAVTLKATKKQD